MTYYIFIQNDKLNGAGQCRQLTDGVLNLEVTEEEYNAFIEAPEKYIYSGGEIVENPDYEAEQAQKERERIDMLSLTAADVERAIYKAKNIDFDDILELVKSNPNIDPRALKIELKANNFYRGNPYIEQVGALLGFTPEMLDKFFETGDYTKLIPPPIVDEPVEEVDNPEDEAVNNDTETAITGEEVQDADTTNTESDIPIPTPIEDSIPEEEITS